MRHIIVQSICRGMELGKIEIESTQDELKRLNGGGFLKSGRSETYTVSHRKEVYMYSETTSVWQSGTRG